MMKTYLIWLLLAGMACNAWAQPFSYVYIQGDKVTPFYVKREGQMMPRYGKNYCILSELDSGDIHIQIEFEQRRYPPLKYTIHVPYDGFRGLLLDKRDTGYALYDLKTKEWLAH